MTDTISPDDFLSHYGVLGMRWGVRKEDDDANRPTEHERKVLSAVGANRLTEDRMSRMYGPKSNGVTAEQRNALIGLGVGTLSVGAIAAALVLARKGKISAAFDLLAKKGPFKQISDQLQKARTMKEMHKQLDDLFANLDDLNVGSLSRKEMQAAFDEGQAIRSAYEKAKTVPKTKFQEFLDTSNATKLEHQLQGYSKATYDKLSREAFELPAGSLVKRLSTEREKVLDPAGFFAAHLDDDVERYKAVLPIYWKMFGLADEGFVISLKANKAIKAPSPRETVDTLKEMFDDLITIEKTSIDDNFDFVITKETKSVLEHLRDMTGAQSANIDDALREIFPSFSLMWTRGADSTNAVVDAYFKRIRSKGYNALIDMNDAGSIGDQPIRMLDGSVFDILEHSVLSRKAILEAQDRIIDLLHALVQMLSETSQDFLSHYGVQGMRWGHRKQEPERVESYRNQQYRKSVERGTRLLNSSNDSQGMAASLEGGKVLAAWILTHVGAYKLDKLVKNPKVRTGALWTARILALGITVKSIMNIDDISNAQNERDKKK